MLFDAVFPKHNSSDMLYWYDGPLLCFTYWQGANHLVYCIDEDEEGHPIYLVLQVSGKRKAAIKANALTLYQAIRFRESHVYMVKYSHERGDYYASYVGFRPRILAEHLPERHHRPIYRPGKRVRNQRRKSSITVNRFSNGELIPNELRRDYRVSKQTDRSNTESVTDTKTGVVKYYYQS